MLIEFIYVSTASESYTWADLEVLRHESSFRNKLEKITGMLLFDGQHFMQVLEGEEPKILALFNKIKKDKRHFAVEPLIHNPINKRHFETWSMGFISCNGNQNMANFDEMAKLKKKPLSFKLLTAFARHQILFDEPIGASQNHQNSVA
ncbi:BLUF domain-containing protein [Pseudoalteromonas xiamenensis]|uniref:BLUF domain-containing protein n=1 Tax=Pseudoalteromonas xiamenensis TaxID=882626 RepID=UPI0027E43CC8|nr:BLUF domain-containing protein [Pseudoalteromonas xiamenensis]WMN60013.1 BLUF domain-containing protein [Pseudoalteromonas xiamenensis]